MNPILDTVFYAANLIIEIYIIIIIASAIMSWLVAFNVINTRNQFVYQIGYALHRLTEPLLRPIRNIVPNLGGIDISPVILLLLLFVLQRLLFNLQYGM